MARRRFIGHGSSTLGLLLALLVLNSALTFQNRWPTVGVRWVPELSVELAALLLALVLSPPGAARRGADGATRFGDCLSS